MTVLLLCMLVMAGLTGCGSSSQVLIENPQPIHTSEYDPIFQAAIAELKDRGYRIDQQNYRFGIITTQVQTSPTALEPWHASHYTPGQALGSTVNYQRRQISVQLKPVAITPDATQPEQPEQSAKSGKSGSYLLEVNVNIQQVETPLRHLTGSTSPGRIFRDDRLPTAAQARQGVRENYWRNVGRDESLENQLVADILRRSIDIARAQYASSGQ